MKHTQKREKNLYLPGKECYNKTIIPFIPEIGTTLWKTVFLWEQPAAGGKEWEKL